MGFAVNSKHIAVGSEGNSVVIYHPLVSRPIASFEFDADPSAEQQQKVRDGSQRLRALRFQPFVSTVAWRENSGTLLAANSRGVLKILEVNE